LRVAGGTVTLTLEDRARHLGAQNVRAAMGELAASMGRQAAIAF